MAFSSCIDSHFIAENSSLVKRGDIVFLSSTGGEGSNPNIGGEASNPNIGGEASNPNIGGKVSNPSIVKMDPLLKPYAPVYGQGENPTVFTTADHGERITC
jgi:hypothetical protein